MIINTYASCVKDGDTVFLDSVRSDDGQTVLLKDDLLIGVTVKRVAHGLLRFTESNGRVLLVTPTRPVGIRR